MTECIKRDGGFWRPQGVVTTAWAAIVSHNAVGIIILYIVKDMSRDKILVLLKFVQTCSYCILPCRVEYINVKFC